MADLLTTGRRTDYGQFDTFLPESSASRGDIPTIDQATMDRVSMQSFNTVNKMNTGVGPLEHIARSTLGIGINLTDNVWSSPINPVSWFSETKGDVWSLASQAEKDYFGRNEALIEGASGIVGAIGAVVAAEALLMPRLVGALTASTAVTSSRVWQAGRAWTTEARIGVLEAQKAATAAGESFTLLNNPAGRKYLTGRIASNVGVALRQEAVIYGTMWNNDVINVEGWGEDAFWIGVGMGLGATVGLVQARATLRRGANSAEVRTTAAESITMAGVADAMVSGRAFQNPSAVRPEGRVYEDSAELTQYLFAARSASPQGIDTPAALESQIRTLRTAAEQEATNAGIRMFSKRIEGVDTIPENLKNAPEFHYFVDEAGRNDPAIAHGLSSIGYPQNSMQAALRQRESSLVKLREKAQAMSKTAQAAEARKELARIARLQKQEPLALVNGTWLRADSPVVAAAEGFDPRQAKKRITFAEKGTTVAIDLPNRGEVIMDASLQLRKRNTAHKVNFAKLPDVDRLHVIEAARAHVDRLASPKTPAKFRLTSDSAKDWFSLDMADEILRRGGQIEWADKSGRLMTRSDIQRESLRIKARTILSEVGATGEITDAIRVKFNLPEPVAFERLEDSAGDTFRTWLAHAASDQGSVHELHQALLNARSIQGVDLVPKKSNGSAELTGDLLNWNRDKHGNFMRPALAYFNPKSTIESLADRGHTERMMARVAESVAILTERTKDTFVHKLARLLVQSPGIQEARKVNELINEQATGLGGGLGQAVAEFLPKRFLSRDNGQNLAASRIHETANRAADMQFRDLMEATNMKGVVTAMNSAGKAHLAAQLDEFASLRPGWDIDEAIEVTPGKWAFPLLDTETNRVLLGVDKIEDGDFMMNTRLNKPILMSTEALSAIQAFEKITQPIREGTNAIRAARGQRDIGTKKHFFPAPSTRGKFVGFVFDPNDQLVRMRTIIADTAAEYKMLQDRTLSELGAGHSVRSRQELEATRTIWDEEAMDWIDHGHSSATAGRGKQGGGLTGAYTRVGAFTEALEWSRDMLRMQANETVQTLMAEPIRLARMRAVAARKVDPTIGRTIFDEWEQALTGNSMAYRDSAILSKVVSEAEAGIDKILASSGMHIATNHIVNVAKLFGTPLTRLSKARNYKQLTEELGADSPFANMTEYLESQGVHRPATVRAVATKLNSLATNLILRWDPAMAHATMNMLGLIPTLTAGVAAGSAPASIALKVKGRTVPLIDSMAIIKGAIGDMTHRKSHKDWQYMVNHGDAVQSSLEYHQTIGAIDSQAGFQKWAGNLDKWLAWASDGSENLSRQMAMFTGLRLADHQGLKTMAERHAFAREFANSAIADYTPSNRPELYQTAFGSVFGLFQSYVVNQYTKMFHWMEQGQYKAMGVQAAIQASMFGVPGTYGVGKIMDYHDKWTGEPGEPNLIDGMYNRFGPTIGGALAHGSLGELTQIALWTRGDMDIRVPAISGMMPPGIDTMQRVSSIITGTASTFLNQQSDDAIPMLLEHIQREMPNRMLKGIMAVMLLDGTETDRYGQVTTQTQTWLDTLTRIAGVRSRRAQAELEVFYQNKSDIERDAARMDRVRMAFRTDVRKATADGEMPDPVKYFDRYVEAGGNPRTFKTWAKGIVRDASSPRAAQQLRKSLETPRNNIALWRYGGYGVWGIDDGVPAEPVRK